MYYMLSLGPCLFSYVEVKRQPVCCIDDSNVDLLYSMTFNIIAC